MHICSICPSATTIIMAFMPGIAPLSSSDPPPTQAMEVHAVTSVTLPPEPRHVPEWSNLDNPGSMNPISRW